MRVSPDPFEMEKEDEIFDEKEPRMRRRPEGLRIFLFLVIYIACSLLVNLAASTIINAAVQQRQIRLMSAVSMLSAYVGPVAAVLINRRVTFRSRFPWWAAALMMVTATFLWQMLLALAMNMLSRSLATAAGAMDIHMAFSTVMALVWMALQYLIQRFGIFHGTIDTL